MQLVGLVVAVVPEHLDVVEHRLDDLLRPLEFPLDLVAVVLGVLGEEYYIIMCNYTNIKYVLY